MAKVFVINGVRCVPENNNALSADKRAAEFANAVERSIERADLARTVLTVKANEILKSL